MARLNLTAEGRTEQQFALEVLAPHLASQSVYLAKPRLAAIARKGGYVHRGGLTKYLPVKNDIKRWLSEDQNTDAFFTTMFDLYALPRDFPGFDAASEEADPYERVARLERSLAEDIGDRRFIPYIQLYEFEALLLADPTAFACYYDQHKRQIAKLVTLCGEADSPELINDGRDTAPSKRIGKQIPEYLSAKPTAGPIIAAHIGVDVIRAKCPHFSEWLSRLEALASAPPTNA